MAALSNSNRTATAGPARRFTIRFATIGLASVLALLTSFALWAGYTTNRAARGADESTRMSDAYQQAKFAVAAEESLERKYRLEPGAEVLARHRAAGKSLLDTLHYVTVYGNASERSPIAAIVVEHSAYLRATALMFAAVRAGDTKQVLAIDGGQVDPIFDKIEHQVSTLAAHEHADALTNLRNLRHDETTVLVATPIAFAVGMALLALFWGIVLNFRRRAAQQAADHEFQALHDSLTGLPNRALLHDRIGQAILQAERDLVPAALLLLDLDRFKEINDTLGHQCGDDLLVQVGERVRALLRNVDTVARLGGDEFAILLPGIGSVEGAEEVARKLTLALEQPFVIDGLELDVEASIGVSLHPDRANDAAELLQQADIAMYAAKAAHAGFMVFDPALDQHSPRRLALLGQLRRAIEASQLVLHYQPKVDARDGGVIGAEALVRWDHPEHGLIPPCEFVPLAERTGLIQPLTRFVLDAAIGQCRRWQEVGYELPVSVNVSARCLLDPTFADEVAELLAKWGVAPSALLLEITESTIISNPARALEVLEQLHTSGIELSIDDFGTGYSSMAYLKDLPVQELKVDRSFVTHMTTSNRDAVIVRSTIELGRSLGLRVVAEGVEDAPTWDQLFALGCDAVQGYHISRPIAADELDRWLEHGVPTRDAA
jgi:diguanylate cyclase (GGDEF)-like protein